MAECPDGRTSRGTRSQFRVGLPSLGLSKGFYPINLEKIMDAGQSSQISSSSIPSSSRDLISPCKGTHTLTVREYEQTIDELKKENFNLKLKLYLCEETHKKPYSDKDSTTPNDEMVQVIVHLNSEAESLRAELKNKEELLQDALERIEKLELDCKELEKINANLQSELTSFSELPSKEEISLLLEEKENFVNHVESLENLIKEKEEEIDTLNQKIEILANENTRLEEKVKKRSLAIQGFVYKSYKEKEMLPGDLKNIVITATQAAKKNNKDGVAVAVKSFTSALKNIMSASEQSLNQSEEKENIGSPTTKCLTEEILEKSTDSFLASQTVSPSHLAQIQDLKEVLSERNIHDTKQTKSLDSFVHHSFIRGKMVHQNAVNISEQGVVNFCDISPSTEENLISFSQRPSLQTFSTTEVISIDNEITSPTFYKLIPEKDASESDQLVNILKENEQLKHDLEEKLALIKDLHVVNEELKGVHLQKIRSDASKASQQCCVSTQTKIVRNNILDEYEIRKLEKEVRLSDDVEELRENVLLLLLAVEEKDKELSEVKQSLLVVQEDLKKALTTTSSFDKEFYMHERNELHERLATSCSINEKLMKHLKSLEKFMEDLLQHKFDSSLESLTDKSDFMSSVSKCLNESLNLSRILSDNLSICEGSKLFEECESFAYKNSSYSEEKDLPSLGLNRFSIPEQLSNFGSHALEEYISYTQKSNVRVGKESDSSQLCWRCWQQLNPSLTQSELSHLTINNSIPKPVGYQSSDSDIWSEPDRNVSMQRIGISLQNSPVSSKSPRKLRQKDKRLSSRISSKEDTSSSEYLQASKKRQGSVSRRLFAKTQDFVLDKFYFLVSEKSSRLKSLLDELESVEDGKLSNDGWLRLNMIVMATEDARQKLHFARENVKTSPVCGKCVMLELFSNIKVSHKESDFFIHGTSFEQKILQEFSKELSLLKEACKEPFLLLNETVGKRSRSSQSDILSESEQIKKLEAIINDLTNKNNELNEKLEEIKQVLSKEKEELVSVKAENSKLLNKIDNLKIDLIDMRYKEKEFSLKNENLAKELNNASKNNSELDNSLKDLEQKRKESTIALDQLTAELEKKKSDLNHMNEKCLEFEKHLNEQIHMRENSENKLKNLQSESLREKNYYLSIIDDLKAEKNRCIQELKNVKEEKFAFEKENAVVKDRLESKNNELLSLKETIEKLQNMKETQKDTENGINSAEKVVLESVKTENFRLLSEINHLKEELLDVKYKEKELSFENRKLTEELDHVSKNYSEQSSTLNDLKQKNKEFSSTTEQLKAELQKNKLDLSYLNKKCLEYEKQLNEQFQMKEKYESQLKSLESKSSRERENYVNQLDAINAEKNLCQQELKNLQEKVLSLEKDNAVNNSTLHSKNDEVSSLRKTVEILENAKETLISDHEAAVKNYLNQLDAINAEKNLCEQELKNIREKVISLEKDNAVINSSLHSKTDELSSLRKTVEILENAKKVLISDHEAVNKSYLNQLNAINAEKHLCQQELKNIQEKVLALEKDNAVINSALHSKDNELLSLKKTVERLENDKEVLISDHESAKRLLSKSRESSESTETENLKLLNHVNQLEEESSVMKNKVNQLEEELSCLKNREKELGLKNEKLVDELTCLSKNNSELNSTLRGIEQKRKESSIALNQMTAELQRNKSDLIHMNEKGLEYEEQLNELIQMKENYENQLKYLETELQSEKNNYLHKIDNLNTENSRYVQELKTAQEKRLALEKENAVINDRLQSKNNELLALKGTMEKLQSIKKTENDIENESVTKEKIICESIKSENSKLLKEVDSLKEQFLDAKFKEKELSLKNKKVLEELDHVSKNYSELNNILEDLKQKNKESQSTTEQLKSELQKSKSELAYVNKKCLEYEKQLKEQIQMKEKFENELKMLELNSSTEKENYLHQLDSLNAERNHYEQELKDIKTENLNLSNQINQMEKELSQVKKKEKELSLENKKLIDKLKEINKCNSELCSTLKILEQKRKESDIEFDHLTAELQKSRSDFDHWSEKCLAHEKQLDEQNQIEEKFNNEKKDYLIQINKLNTEKDHYLQKLESVQEKNFHLEKEIGAVNDTLQSKNNELLSLQKTVEELREQQLVDQTQIKEKYENELKNERKDYLSQISKLNAEKDNYLQKLNSVQEMKLHLEKEINSVKDRLKSKNNEILSLQKTVEELQKANKTLDSNYEELQCELVKSRECLQEKCKTCEEVIIKLKEVELEYCQQLKQLEAKSTSEKEKLLNKISMLTKENEDILQKLNDEKEHYKKLKAENVELKQLEAKSTSEKEKLLNKISVLTKENEDLLRKLNDEEECYKKLKAENVELNENYLRSSHQVSTLKQRNEFFQNASLSSNKECDSLSKELKCLRNTLQNLESKCLMYEKQLVATAGIKDNLTECLLNINNEFSIQRQKLNEMCKTYHNEDSVTLDETFFTKFIPTIDEDNVSKICESIVSETKKLSQSVDMLLSILKSYHLKSTEIQTSEEKNRVKTQSLEKEIEFYKTEVESLRVQNDHLQYIIDELQNSLSEKEKSIQRNASQVKTLEEKLQNSQKEIDGKNQLIQRKDDEITRLQERIFNLQIYISSIMTDKKNMLEKATSMNSEKLMDSISSCNQLPSKAISTDTKMCQTDEYETITQSIDESFSSVSSLESGKNRCCEKYWKKCYSLQTKLAVYQKRIEILEKNKDDLKERLLQQIQNKRDSVEKSDSAVSKIVELESKLEKKKLFICELKSELLKTCNSLIDKEKEVDDIKQKLAECETKFKHEALDASKIHPIASMTSVDANVKTLKNHKWKLIQTIFDIQRKFYEKKDIHLNYFDRFKEHVNNLYSLQLIPTVSKSESMPILRSHALKKHYEEGNEKVKKLADLELDIECLENLKIFLNRFLVPCVFQTPETSDKHTEIEQKTVSSDQLSSPVKLESRRESKHDITDILNLSFPEAFIISDNEKNLSIDVIASNISQHLDSIKIFLDAVTTKNWSKMMDLSVEDSVDKAEVKSLLSKIFQEINVLHKGANKLFNFNAHLRSFDCVASLQAPLSMTKLDASDRESIMSEETIAVSRTESPLSFEDTCPIKLPHPKTLQLEENTLKNESVRNTVTVIEPYSAKITVVDGSCDSVCQRSHYSSPDLGIESDPNHESSAPEHKEDGANKYQMFPFKLQPSKTPFTESAGRWSGPKFGERFYAVGTLPHFELLKQEIKECLVAIKSVLSRTGDGLHHIAKYTSPRKTLEYNTLKSIKDTCVHMEVCLKEANNLVGKFWTAPCPTEKEWKMLIEENQKLSGDLACLRTLVEKQENEFKTAMGKLERAQVVKDNMEKKISKKLVKTKKLIRQAELKLLETRCQNFPPVPKYPSEQTQKADAQ